MVKTRKIHTCDQCYRVIPVGEVAIMYEGKGPRYDDDDRQVGVWFWRGYICQYQNHDMKRMQEEYEHFIKPMTDGNSTAT